MQVCDVVIMGALGRMGSMLCSMVQESDQHRLAGVVERPNAAPGLSKYECVGAGDVKDVLAKSKGAVVIDFTAPEATLATLDAALEYGNPMVIGTTGLTAEQVAHVEEAAKSIPVFMAPNMSIGISVLLDILPQLVKKLGPQYDLEVMEIHHNKKVDSPSGTALKLGQCLAQARDENLDDVKQCCREGIIGARPDGEIGLQAIRGGDVVGDHTVYFLGPAERIEVTHRAHSRSNFASGALRAAHWLASQQPGKLYAMADMLI
ncbi:4-hydroxy-tetrahydrodipicolinate reductase [Desulfovibrio inopinatus]|uniref:4-hydroxy-tetrahydrodipicolinate reductase n=1 Tax=Desulfovibrio inopinatus TaxID=102109 RepID=UPI00040497EC|nr:4-hydroxy-tetrahydrodipicolinate reductase [Desulfovibrio inopinatus]